MEDKVVKNTFLKSVFVCVCILVMAGLMSAQTLTTTNTAGGVKTFTLINPPPCDFSDRFYMDNGVNSQTGSELNSEPDGRFGTFRQFGPPATGSQANWTADPTCSPNDPTRRNFRILATTGAFKDDSGAPTEFFSIIAFAHSTNFFLQQTFTDDCTDADTGCKLQITDAGRNPSPPPAERFVNLRGFTQEEIVNNFEAYGAPKQRVTSGPFAGTLAPMPCGSLADPLVAANDCFPVRDTFVNGSTLSNAATPNLRMDWRVASNRNAMDGSDNNCINNDLGVCPGGIHDSPFGYFCDDLLGMWIVTYFWYTQNAVGGVSSTGGIITPTTNCNHVLSCISQIYGNSLDGTPILKTGNQLHFIEGVSNTPASVFPGQGVPGACLQDSDLPVAACGREGNLDAGGADGGAVWLVCPVMQDPRNGGVAKDAFLDVVRLSNGNSQDTGILNNFSCLQSTGKFCNEAAPEN